MVERIPLHSLATSMLTRARWKTSPSLRTGTPVKLKRTSVISAEPACNKEMTRSSRKFGRGTVRKRKRRGKQADFTAAFPKEKTNPAIQSKRTARTLPVSRRSGATLSPAKRTLRTMMTDKNRKMPPPALKERLLKIVRRSMNTKPAVRKGINMRWEASSFVSDNRTRATSGLAKRRELTATQTPNNSQRFKTLFRVSCNVLDSVTLAYASNFFHAKSGDIASSSSVSRWQIGCHCFTPAAYLLNASARRVIPLVVVPILTRSRTLEPLAVGLVPFDRSANP